MALHRLEEVSIGARVPERVWGEQQQPEVFLRPVDMDDVIAGWNRAHG